MAAVCGRDVRLHVLLEPGDVLGAARGLQQPAAAAAAAAPATAARARAHAQTPAGGGVRLTRPGYLFSCHINMYGLTLI